MEREKIDARILVEANVHIHHHHHHHAPRAVSSTLTFKGGGMSSSASILVGQSIPAIYQEFAADGSVVAPVGAVAYSSDNPAVATVDPVSGMCQGVSAGSANISANDAGLAAPGLPASGALSVSASAPVAVSSSLTFGAPSGAAAPKAAAVDASGAVKGRAPASK